MPSVLAVLGPVFLALAVAGVARERAMPDIAWPDEVIYLVGARNVVERGSLDTNFYLTYSLLRRGYPHRDVHMATQKQSPGVDAASTGTGASELRP